MYMGHITSVGAGHPVSVVKRLCWFVAEERRIGVGGRTGRSTDGVRVAFGVHAAGRGERRETGRGPDDVGGEVGVEGQRGGGDRVVGVETADGEAAAVGVDLGGRGGGAGGVLVSGICVGLGGGDEPELEAGEKAKGRECEGLHLGVWGFWFGGRRKACLET
jgi:hypothetical protein